MDQRIIDKSVAFKSELREYYGISPKSFWRDLTAMGFYDKFPSMKHAKILHKKHILFIISFMDEE